MTAGNGLPCARCGTSSWYNNGACAACAKERTSRWCAQNPGKNAEHQRRYREQNSAKRAEYNRLWRENNPDKAAELRRRWYENNPEKKAALKHRRRTRKTNAGGSYTAAEWRALCKQYDNRCACCGKEKKLTFDHVIPVSKGGSSDISNGQPLCVSCNSSKGDKSTDYRTKPGIARWIQRKLFG